MVNRVCEAFTCTPSVALRELELLAAGAIEAILDFRSFRDAKRVYQQAKTAADMPDSPWIDLVRDLDFAKAAAAVKAAHG